MIDLENVLSIHEQILSTEKGLKGSVDLGKLDSALNRIDNWQTYENTDNIFDIAALYAVAIAKAHAFSDGNKRTAMVTMLSYLKTQGVIIKENIGLDDIMVLVADSKISIDELSVFLQKNNID
ncbi:MAG: type II toxin-antitoxin system death-on-curing family toxin [Neisseriaceae bacterium]|nr:type II toxin-antitoxin system death-on-curing family toxin [Neisseriaceae bacterium]